MGDRSGFPLPHHRLAPGRARRFGNPYAGTVRWAPWDEDATWRTSAAWVQHRVAQRVTAVLDGEADPACDLELGSTDEERRAQVAAFCGMGTRRLDELLRGRVPIRTFELLAFLAVAGIDAFPVTVEELLPDERLTDPGGEGTVVRRVEGRRGTPEEE